MQGQDVGENVQDLTLVSTLARGDHNQISDFSTRLDHPLRLEGDWKVGVTSVSFSKNINNLPYLEDGFVKISMVYYEPYQTGGSDRYEGDADTFMRPGNYLSPQGLVQAIYENTRAISLTNIVSGKVKIMALEDFVSITFNQPTGKMHFDLIPDTGMDTVRLVFSNRLKVIIGLGRNALTMSRLGERHTIAPRGVDINAGVYMMFIKTNIIEHGFVGERGAEVLKTVPLTGLTRTEGYTNIQFPNIEWRSVKPDIQFLREITIKVDEDLTEQNNPIKFSENTAPVLLELKFRKVRG